MSVSLSCPLHQTCMLVLPSIASEVKAKREEHKRGSLISIFYTTDHSGLFLTNATSTKSFADEIFW